MKKKQIRTMEKRRGTKKQYKASMKKRRCESYSGRKLGTLTHKSNKDYDRNREKTSLRKEAEEAE